MNKMLVSEKVIKQFCSWDNQALMLNDGVIVAHNASIHYLRIGNKVLVYFDKWYLGDYDVFQIIFDIQNVVDETLVQKYLHEVTTGLELLVEGSL